MAVALELFVQEYPGGAGRWEGDDEAFARVYARTFHPLVSYCQRLVGDRAVAEDVAQEAMANAWASWDRYSAARPFWPWVATIARRLCIDRKRHEDRRLARRDAEARLCERTDPEPDELLARQDERRIALTALRRLRPGQQRILGLREIDGWSYEDIARFEGKTVESVRAGLRRARVALRSAYQQVAAGAPAVLGLRFLRRVRQRFSHPAGRAQVAMGLPPPVLLERIADTLAGIAALALTATAATSGAVAVATTGAPAPTAYESTVDSGGAAAAAGAGSAGAGAAVRPTTAAPAAGLVPITLPVTGAQRPADANVVNITPSPNYAEDGTLFAVGSPRDGCAGGGCWSIFKSTDRGATWTHLDGVGLPGGDVLLPPAYPADNRIFVGGPSALAVSLDDGETFQPVTPLGGAVAMSPRFSSGDPRILVGSAPGWEFHAAAGSAGTVLPLSYAPPATGTTLSFAFAGDPADPRVLVGGTRPDGAETMAAAVYVCTTTGCSMAAPLPGAIGSPTVVTSPSFSRGGPAYASVGNQLYRSLDGGQTFAALPVPGGGTVRQVAFAGDGALLLATSAAETDRSGGLFRSPDSGATWTQLGTDTRLAAGALSVAALRDGRLLAGPAGIAGGGLLCSSDAGRTWAESCG